jgi:hypothetical protein
MTKRRGEVEIIPPNPRSNAPARVSLTPVTLPARLSSGDLFLRPLTRYEARSRAMTYTALGAALRAESEATQAAADMHRARLDRATALAEMEELPERLAQERYLRQLSRFQVIRNLEHEIALAEIDHQSQVTRKSAELMQATTDLTIARANCTAARQRLADATQAYSAQLEYGDQHYALMWERKINEETLFVEEQRTVLQEHRERLAPADRTRAQFDASPIDLGTAAADDASGEAVFKFKRTR